MERYHSTGQIRAIGISNFNAEHVTELLKTARVVPMVNQIELNAYHHDDATIEACRAANIPVEASSPLGSPGRSKSGPSIFHDPLIGAIAKSHNVSKAQVALRWIYQHGHILTVLSENGSHQANDADIFNFKLTSEEMSRLDKLQNKSDALAPAGATEAVVPDDGQDQCESSDDCPPSPWCTVICAYVPSQGRKMCVCA